jgi:hypothetical protein
VTWSGLGTRNGGLSSPRKFKVACLYAAEGKPTFATERDICQGQLRFFRQPWLLPLNPSQPQASPYTPAAGSLQAPP